MNWDIDKLKGATYCNKVCMYINEHGLKDPIVVKSDGTVIDGKKRLAAARFLGYSVVGVEVVPDIDSGIKPIEFPLFSFIQAGSCKNRIYLKVSETEYLEFQAGESIYTIKEEDIEFKDLSRIEHQALAFQDMITYQSIKSYGMVATQVVSQYTKPANHFRLHTVVRLHGGSHPYVIYAKSKEEIFMRSLVSGQSRSYELSSKKLFTQQIVTQADIA